MRAFVKWLGSLTLAMPLLVLIAAVLGWGTIYEAQFGTAAVQRFVYRAWWFQALLGFLAVNLAAAALERYPWKRSQAPFLLAHLGIILILIGGILGGQFGIEGQLIIPEGQAERMLQLPQKVLVVSQPNPGISHAITTNFETTAWVHEPHALFRIPLERRTIQLVVDRYYPDAAVDEQITDDGDADNSAALLAVSRGEQQEQVWLLAEDPERFGVRWGEAHLLFLAPKTEQRLAAVLGQSNSGGSAHGIVTLEFPDLGVRQDIPVPDDFSRPVPVGGTPYAVTFKDYFTDLAVTDQGVVNRSDEPNNPAVAFTLTGPEGVDAYLVFALHPDFSALHGRRHTIHAYATYTHGAAHASLPPNSIGLIRHVSGGALSCVLTDEAGASTVTACEPGHRYTHPSLGYEFELLAVYPRARVTPQFRNRSDEVHAEALHLVVQEGESAAESWLWLRGSAELTLGAHPIRVEYTPAQRELPFTITLLDFRKIDYPGTQMAAAFESDVQLSDPQRGIILTRTIKMNQPLRYRGFSCYQSSYVPGTPETTVLSVRNDPGTPLVYAGFLIVMAGVVLMFALPQAKAASRRKNKER